MGDVNLGASRVWTWAELLEKDSTQLTELLCESTWGRAIVKRKPKKHAGQTAAEKVSEIVLKHIPYEEDEFRILGPKALSNCKIFNGGLVGIVLRLSRIDRSHEMMHRRFVYYTINDCMEHHANGRVHTHADPNTTFYTDIREAVDENTGKKKFADLSWAEYWYTPQISEKGIDMTMRLVLRDAGVIVARWIHGGGWVIGLALIIAGIILATTGDAVSITRTPTQSNPPAMGIAVGLSVIYVAFIFSEYIRLALIAEEIKPKRTHALQSPLAGTQVAVGGGLLIDFLVFYGIILPIFGYGNLFRSEEESNVWLRSGTATSVWFNILFFFNIACTIICAGLLVYLHIKDPAAEPSEEPLPPFCHCRNCEHSYSAGHRRHCRTCHKCTSDFDHHCDFLNQCIGGKNYTPWFTMVASLTCMTFTQTVVSAISIGVVATGSETGHRADDATGAELFYFLAVFSLCLQAYVTQLAGTLMVLHINIWKKRVTSGHFVSQINYYGLEFEGDYEKGLIRNALWKWTLQTSLKDTSTEMQRRPTYDTNTVKRFNNDRTEEQVYFKLMANANVRLLQDQGNPSPEAAHTSAGHRRKTKTVPASRTKQSWLLWCVGQAAVGSEDVPRRTETGIPDEQNEPNPIVNTDSCLTATTRAGVKEQAMQQGVSTYECQLFDEVFDLLDQDKDGLLSEADLSNAMRGLDGTNFSSVHIQELISQRNPRQPGCLDYGEFAEMMIAAAADSSQDSPEDLTEVYTMMTTDDAEKGEKVSLTSGYLKKRLMKYDKRSRAAPDKNKSGEAVFTWSRECDVEWNQMFDEFDQDGDGELSLDEFVGAIQRRRICVNPLRNSNHSDLNTTAVDRGRSNELVLSV